MNLNSFNLEFKLKDFNNSFERNYSRIKTLKDKDVKLSDIINGYTDDSIIGSIVGSTQWSFYYQDRFKEGITKSSVRELKTLINYKTREYIQRELEYNNLSKHYDTAFYLLHYKRINSLMKRITKELLKNYVGC